MPLCLFGAETESAISQQKSAYHYKQFLDNVLLKEQIRQAAIRGISQNVGKNNRLSVCYICFTLYQKK